MDCGGNSAGTLVHSGLTYVKTPHPKGVRYTMFNKVPPHRQISVPLRLRRLRRPTKDGLHVSTKPRYTARSQRTGTSATRGN